MRRRRRRDAASGRLKLRAVVHVPESNKTDEQCNEVCVRNEYCEANCNENYDAVVKEALKTAAKRVVAIADQTITAKHIETSERKLVLPPAAVACAEGKIDVNGTCEETCVAPRAPSNGSLTWEDGEAGVVSEGRVARGSRVHYTCHAGYELVGSAGSVCTGAAGWSSPAPSCSECPMNTFKTPEMSMNKSCEACPPNSVTEGRGSTSPEQCKCQ